MKKNTNRTVATRVATVAIAIAILAGAAPAIASASAATTTTTFSSQLSAATTSVKFAAATSDTTALSTASVKVLAAVPVKTTAATTSTTATKATAVKRAATTDELGRAKAILAGLVARYPILQGTTVSFGDARGYQAIALYKSGRIIISPTHTASLEKILNHEVWHIIDWRDNGRIDWGEQVPPK